VLVRAAVGLLSCAGLFVAARAALTLLGGYRSLELEPAPPPPQSELLAQLLAGGVVLLFGLALYARSGLLSADLSQLTPRCDEPAPERDLKRANVVVLGLSLLGVFAAVACFAWG